MINDLPKSLIECATKILTPIAEGACQQVEPIKDSPFVHGSISWDVNNWLAFSEVPSLTSDELHDTHIHNDDDKTHVFRYTSSPPRKFNNFLYDSYKKGVTNPSHFEVMGEHNFTHDVKGLDAAVNRNKLEMQLTTYSGIGWHPHERTDVDGVVHLPVYTSTSLCRRIAYKFANSNKHNLSDLHILRIKNNIGDSGFYTKNDNTTTKYDDEHEFIIPRNTKIKIAKTPVTYRDKEKNTLVHIWDAERIHSAPADIDYKTPNGNVELYNQNNLKLYQTHTLSALHENYPEFYKQDNGKSFHEHHIIRPVFHLHTPDNDVYQGKTDNRNEPPTFASLKSGKSYSSDDVLDKYPQLEKFRDLFD